ncbi:MAG: low specificity L-threonine aldolase [Clostridiales bacterium]|nr:low specificity L-threonine aldolase [Clostridiales bacterium]
MLWFRNDYSEGAHEEVLKKLCETGRCHRAGYGDDEYSALAREKLRKACGMPDADIVFLTGGTQVNATVIAAMLKPFEGALSAVTGHINCHEAGAVEFAGCKVLPLPQYAGKVKAEDVQAYLDNFYADESHTHMVFPGLLYISHPTEYGTLYTKAELAALRKACDTRGVRLFLDGARMAYGLAAEGTDVTLPDIAKYCHAFTIGGTKCGALCGEAAVFAPGCMPERFITLTKQRGAMLAKSSLNGLQFDALFSNDLYKRVGEHTIRMAMKLKKALLDKGYEFYIDSPTNQQFPIVDETVYARLKEQVEFGIWERLSDGRIVIRLCTSWATDENDLDALIGLL